MDERSDKFSDSDLQKWTALAIVVGFNELAKAATTLGEKVFFRLARDQAEKNYASSGGVFRKIPVDGEETILVIDDSMPQISFQARDIELMRA